jgi:hypothetical protein
VLHLAPLIAFAASAALAFTPTHLVIVDSTPLYEKEHPFDEEHILTHLEYWTELAATARDPVLWRNEPYRQWYYVVILESGAEGLVNGLDAGGALVAVIDKAPVYPHDTSSEIIDTLDKGEIVALPNVRGCIITHRVDIRTKEKLDACVDRGAVEPTYVFPTPPHKKYGRPQGGPPQHAGHNK